jgi:hypothetical protein
MAATARSTAVRSTRVYREGGDLVVTFRDGSRYRYIGAAEHAAPMAAADSIGRYLNAHVRNAYPATREG